MWLLRFPLLAWLCCCSAFSVQRSAVRPELFAVNHTLIPTPTATATLTPTNTPTPAPPSNPSFLALYAVEVTHPFDVTNVTGQFRFALDYSTPNTTHSTLPWAALTFRNHSWTSNVFSFPSVAPDVDPTAIHLDWLPSLDTPDASLRVGVNVWRYPLPCAAPSHQAQVASLLQWLENTRSSMEYDMRERLNALTSFHNRYADSTWGRDAAVWLEAECRTILASSLGSSPWRTTQVFTMTHQGLLQPSLIVRLSPHDDPLQGERVIMSAHIDAAYTEQRNNRTQLEDNRAPGALDNGSGVVVLLALLEKLSGGGVAPGMNRTVEFHFYAASLAPVGWSGSRDVVSNYTVDGLLNSVAGVINLDVLGLGESIGIISQLFTLDLFTLGLVREYLSSVPVFVGSPFGYSDDFHWQSVNVPVVSPTGFGTLPVGADDTVDLVDFEQMWRFVSLTAAFVVEVGLSGNPERTVGANPPEFLLYTVPNAPVPTRNTTTTARVTPLPVATEPLVLPVASQSAAPTIAATSNATLAPTQPTQSFLFHTFSMVQPRQILPLEFVLVEPPQPPVLDPGTNSCLYTVHIRLHGTGSVQLQPWVTITGEFGSVGPFGMDVFEYYYPPGTTAGVNPSYAARCVGELQQVHVEMTRVGDNVGWTYEVEKVESWPLGTRQSTTAVEEVDAWIRDDVNDTLLADIERLSALNNRFYDNNFGAQASTELLQVVHQVVDGRSNVSVEAVTHDWSQQSIIVRVEGSDPWLADKFMVVGAHIDAAWHKKNSSNPAQEMAANRAPGANDNASGVAVLLELLRIIVANDIRPLRSLEVHFWSAAQTPSNSFLGSRDIVSRYTDTGKLRNCTGVLSVDRVGGSDPYPKLQTFDDTGDELGRSATMDLLYLHSLAESHTGLFVQSLPECMCSDHVEFKNVLGPAFGLVDNNNNQALAAVDDTPDAVNLEFVTDVLRLVTVYTVEMLQLGEPLTDVVSCQQQGYELQSVSNLTTQPLTASVVRRLPICGPSESHRFCQSSTDCYPPPPSTPTPSATSPTPTGDIGGTVSDVVLLIVLLLSSLITVVVAFMAFFLGRRHSLQVQQELDRRREVARDERAATQDQIELLPISGFTSDLMPDSKAMCAVCLDEYEDQVPLRRLPCKHYFHVECIDRWLIRDKKCPLCKQPIDDGQSPQPSGGAEATINALSEIT